MKVTDIFQENAAETFQNKQQQEENLGFLPVKRTCVQNITCLSAGHGGCCCGSGSFEPSTPWMKPIEPEFMLNSAPRLRALGPCTAVSKFSLDPRGTEPTSYPHPFFTSWKSTCFGMFHLLSLSFYLFCSFNPWSVRWSISGRLPRVSFWRDICYCFRRSKHCAVVFDLGIKHILSPLAHLFWHIIVYVWSMVGTWGCHSSFQPWPNSRSTTVARRDMA